MSNIAQHYHLPKLSTSAFHRTLLWSTWLTNQKEQKEFSISGLNCIFYLNLQCALVRENNITASLAIAIPQTFTETFAAAERDFFAFFCLFLLFMNRFSITAICGLRPVSASSSSSVLIISGATTYFPMVLCLLVVHELWPSSWYCWPGWCASLVKLQGSVIQAHDSFRICF